MSFKLEIDSTLISLGATWNLSGNVLSGLGIPSDPEDLTRAEDAKTRLPIATPGFVSPFVRLSGSMMVGDINIGNKSITDLPVSTVNLAVSSVEATSSGFQNYFQIVQNTTTFLSDADTKIKQMQNVLGLNPGTTCQLLPLSGGTMEGTITMASENLLINLPEAVDDTSPVIRSNLSGKALLAGTALMGDLKMSGHGIDNMKSVGNIASFADKKFGVTVQDVIDALDDTRNNTKAPYIIYNPSPVTSLITSGSLYDWKMTGSAAFTSSDASTYFSLGKSTTGSSVDRIRIYKAGVYILTFFIEYVAATIVSDDRSLLNVRLGADRITVGIFSLNQGKAAYLSSIIPINENFVVAGPYLELVLNNAGTVKQTGWQLSRLPGDL
ncbi:MAG: hypothetical protein RR599_03815 [Victivallaceae bacterium]